LLKTAKADLSAEDYEGALEKYHTALDVAPSLDLRRQALEGMAVIGSPKSLNRIVRYCRDVSPILWRYKKPDQELVNCAARVYVAIANNTAMRDKQKSIKMLNWALTIADSVVHQEVIASLENLGVNIDDDAVR